jgi:hypothetical protein
MFVIELSDSKHTVYVADKAVRWITDDLNKARIYRSKKQVNEAIKAYKDDNKTISRKSKSPLLVFNKLTDSPETEEEVILNITSLVMSYKEVRIVLVK